MSCFRISFKQVFIKKHYSRYSCTSLCNPQNHSRGGHATQSIQVRPTTPADIPSNYCSTTQSALLLIQVAQPRAQRSLLTYPLPLEIKSGGLCFNRTGRLKEHSKLPLQREMKFIFFFTESVISP